MAYEIKSTAEFDACLDEVVAFRVNNYGLRSARRLLDAVDAAGALLADNPNMGSLVNNEPSAKESSPLRWVRVDSYIAVYRVCDAKQTVYLLKLFHGSSNWRRRVLG